MMPEIDRGRKLYPSIQCSHMLRMLMCLALIFLLDFPVATEQDTHYQARAIAGESVHLPCKVDLTERCGDVHSIKFYKDDIRVYVFSYKNLVDRSEDVLLRPHDRADFILDSSPPYLSISPVFLVDEGTYKCDTTYMQVQDGCDSVSYTALTTLARPSAPEIRFEDGIAANMTTIGPFIEETKLSLTCDASGGKPVADVTWWHGSNQIDGQYTETKDPQHTGSGVITIDLTLSREYLLDRFECRAINEALDAPLTAWVIVDMIISPLSVEMTGPKDPITEGTPVTLTCTVRGARPAAVVTWYNETTETNTSPSASQEESDNTFTTVSMYHFIAEKNNNKKTMSCSASNYVMKKRNLEPLEDTFTLEVHYVPRVQIVPEGEAAANQTDTVILECQFDANPMNLTEITFLKDGKVFKHILVNGDSKDDDERSDDGFPILVLPNVSHQHKGVYTCQLGNVAGNGISTNSLELDVYYSPLVKIELSPQVVHEEDESNVTLECLLISANPMSLDVVRWFSDGQMLEETEDNVLVLANVSRSDHGNYSCAALNAMGWGDLSEQEVLLVKYRPGEASLTYSPSNVVKGKNITLTCEVKDQGNPPAKKYRWYRDVYLNTDQENNIMVVNPVTLIAMTNFTCTAYNDVGEGPRARIYIPVLAAPAFVDDPPDTHGELVTATEFSLTCRIECNPLCDVMWHKNWKKINVRPNSEYTITKSILPSDPSLNLLDSVVSTLKWNLTASSKSSLDRDRDNAMYTCTSTGNSVGGGVTANITFQVEYPPENIWVSKESVDVVEGDIPEMVSCNAVALPPPQYRWEFDDDEDDDDNVVAIGPILHLNYSLPREKQGNYTCIVSNRHGNLSVDTFINVLYKPKCIDITRETTPDGYSVITCEISANPSAVEFDWLFENETYNNDEPIETENVLISKLKFREQSDRYGTYVCTANNSVGFSVPCEISVLDGYPETLNKNKWIFVAAAIAALVILLVIIAIVACLFMRRRKARNFGDQGKKKKSLPPGSDEDRGFYENLPFHGLQPPPNKPFKPVLPDLEYADVDFPPRALNNNTPVSKAKIVERILEDVEGSEDEEASSKKTPARPPRSKGSSRK